MQALDVNSIPQGGTAMAAAIKTALTAFKEGNHHKVLVLLTDGEDNDEPARSRRRRSAAKAGLKIFTIGIGTAAGDLLRVTDANGNSDYVRDEQGNVVKSHLNEALLQQIAGATGGFYLPLRGANTIDTLYERGLAPLPKSEGKERLIAALSRAISLAAGGGDAVVAGGNVFAGAQTGKGKCKQHPPSPRPSPPGEGESFPGFNRDGRGRFVRAVEPPGRRFGFAGERVARIPIGLLHERPAGV